MEPEVREFFKRISTSIGIAIIWLMINITIGVKYGYAFYEDKIHLYNIVFYVWTLASFITLVVIFIRMWKQPIEHLND